MYRRNFISLSCLAGMNYTSRNIFPVLGGFYNSGEEFIMTVNGKLALDDMGIILPHEHIVTDFTGAEKVIQPQYNHTDAFNKLLPYLKAVKQRGVSVLVECTPAYIGRDVKLLKHLSKASGLHIITNTGYYAAVGLKYLPRHVFTESSLQLAARWLKEWKYGIEDTGVRPGFIKLGVGKGPLKPIEQKLVTAAAYTHLESGLKIAIHTGDVAAVYDELEIIMKQGVSADALIWVHAQNDISGEGQIELARKGCWISLDGINQTEASIKRYCAYIKTLKQERLLHRVLISHDDGFAVNKNGTNLSLDTFQNGNIYPYASIFNVLKPALLKEGITEEDFYNITVTNPTEAFTIKICAIN